MTEHAKSFGAKGLAYIKVENGEWKSPIVKFFSEAEKAALKTKLAIEEGAVFDGQSRLREEPMTAEVIDLQAAAAGMKAADKANGRSN